MISRATGLFSIYRGATTNLSGDTVDDNTDPIYVDIPLALHNNTVTEESPNTNSPRTIAGYLGRASSGTDLQANDRLQDQNTGALYVIDGVPRAPLSSTRNSDLQFVVHRVN